MKHTAFGLIQMPLPPTQGMAAACDCRGPTGLKLPMQARQRVAVRPVAGSDGARPAGSQADRTASKLSTLRRQRAPLGVGIHCRCHRGLLQRTPSKRPAPHAGQAGWGFARNKPTNRKISRT